MNKKTIEILDYIIIAIFAIFKIALGCFFLYMMVEGETNHTILFYKLIVGTIILTLLYTGSEPTNQSVMKATEARILTDESLNSRFAELENHPEYIDICDKIRAAAMAGESSITVEIFTKDIVGLLDKNCFVIEPIEQKQTSKHTFVFSDTLYSIKW